VVWEEGVYLRATRVLCCRLISGQCQAEVYSVGDTGVSLVASFASKAVSMSAGPGTVYVELQLYTLRALVCRGCWWFSSLANVHISARAHPNPLAATRRWVALLSPATR
jgi:hypothetical protein